MLPASMEVPLKLALFILFLLIVGGPYFFFVWTSYVYQTLGAKARAVATRRRLETLDDDALDHLWHDISSNGSDPLQVIAAAHVMVERPMFADQQKQLHLMISYFSQVEFLARKGHLATAAAFFLKARFYGLQAFLEYSSAYAPEEPIELAGAIQPFDVPFSNERPLEQPDVFEESAALAAQPAEEAPEQGGTPAKEPGNSRLSPIEGKYRRVDPPKDGPRQVLKRDTQYGSASANEPGGSSPSEGTPPEPSAAS